MLSEKQIRKFVPDVLDRHDGVCDKQDIIDYISHDKRDILDYNDLKPSPSRKNEPMFYQRVGNIISHARKYGLDYVEFDEGFAICNKSDNEWLFISLDIIRSDGSIVLPSKNNRLGNIRAIIDWDAVQKKCKELGDRGEQFVYETEYQFVADNFPSEISRVKWVSKENGDGFGYDIKSVCHTDYTKDLLIEVKTTNSNKGLYPFHMSSNEFDVFHQHQNINEILELHRLYNPNNTHFNTLGYFEFKRHIYSQQQIISDFLYLPKDYLVRHK